MRSTKRNLAGFTGAGYDKGRPKVVQALWVAVSTLFCERIWCPPATRVAILRAFGAKIGENVLVRHDVRIHWPWKLTIGDNSWIGVEAWLLNLEPIYIGSNVCISQSAFLCTGSHDHTSPTFEFDNAAIVIEDGVWIAARATVLRGVTVGADSVIGATALVHGNIPPNSRVFAAASTTRNPRGM